MPGRPSPAAVYSVPELTERGWTATAVRRFLPAQPDDTEPNPHYPRAGAPMKLWFQRRVHRVEKSAAFLEWKHGSVRRRAAAERAVSTRMGNMMNAAFHAEITIVRGWTDAQVRDLARRTHGGRYQGDPGPFQWSARTARNCIRHNLTNYEELWAVCNRGETGRAAYEILRERVDAVIDEAYPQYVEDDADGSPSVKRAPRPGPYPFD